VRTSISCSTNNFAVVKSFSLIASFLSFIVSCNSTSNFCKPVGNELFRNRTREPASSITSIALSGKLRSAINLLESFAASSRAGSV